MDDIFWGFLFKLAVYPSKQNTPEKLYDLIVPFLVDKPLEQILTDSYNDVYTDWRSPQRSSISYYKWYVLLNVLFIYIFFS